MKFHHHAKEPQLASTGLLPLDGGGGKNLGLPILASPWFLQVGVTLHAGILKSCFLVIFSAFLASGALSPALAEPAAKKAPTNQERSLGSFGAWNTYSYVQGGQTVCYMVTTKLVKSTGPAKRAPPYLMITHRPIEASTDVISYGAGTLLNAKRGVKLTLGKNSFDLFSVRDTAWARDSLTDHKIAHQILGTPSALAVSLPTAKGSKPLHDQFDLTGATFAYHAIGKACGLPGEMPKKSAPRKSSATKKTPAKKK